MPTTRMGPKPKPVYDRLMRKIERNEGTGCWEFTGGRSEKGYGCIVSQDHGRATGKRVPAHRVAWEQHRGPIPEGMFVRHRCGCRHCCNPDHLFLGTRRESVQDMMQKGRASDRPGGRKAAKLTVWDVRRIRRLAADGHSATDIALRFGTCVMNVRRIVARKTWADV